MSELKEYKSFEDWFSERELFGLRSGRFFEDFSTTVVSWLKAAYEAGQKSATPS